MWILLLLLGSVALADDPHEYYTQLGPVGEGRCLVGEMIRDYTRCDLQVLRSYPLNKYTSDPNFRVKQSSRDDLPTGCLMLYSEEKKGQLAWIVFNKRISAQSPTIKFTALCDYKCFDIWTSTDCEAVMNNGLCSAEYHSLRCRKTCGICVINPNPENLDDHMPDVTYTQLGPEGEGRCFPGGEMIKDYTHCDLQVSRSYPLNKYTFDTNNRVMKMSLPHLPTGCLMFYSEQTKEKLAVIVFNIYTQSPTGKFTALCDYKCYDIWEDCKESMKSDPGLCNNKDQTPFCKKTCGICEINPNPDNLVDYKPDMKI